MVEQKGLRVLPRDRGAQWDVQAVHACCVALRDAIHPEAIVSAAIGVGSFRGEDVKVTVTVYPRGYTRSYGTRDAQFDVTAATWAEVFMLAAKHWEDNCAAFGKDIVRRMALAIIRLTHETGSCQLSGLRAEFTSEDIELYGQAAVTLADEMADGAPFAILPGAPANISPAVEAELQAQAARTPGESA
jgi:hypothetical protein